MNRNEIIGRLRAFPYLAGDYWVITGAAMVLYGIREETQDIDLGCTARAADRLEAEGFLFRKTPDGKRQFRLEGGIEVFEDWLAGSVELVEGIPVVSIPGLIEMKRRLGREKDLRDIALINEHLGRTTGAKTNAEK